MMIIKQSFFFEAAHTLNRTVEREGSLRIHGHTYTVEVSIAGRPNPDTGMVIDLGYFRSKLTKVRDMLDHQFLDEIKELGPATLENLCKFIWDNLEVGPYEISVSRGASGDTCIYRGN